MLILNAEFGDCDGPQQPDGKIPRVVSCIQVGLLDITKPL
jgi:hypothetical protein